MQIIGVAGLLFISCHGSLQLYSLNRPNVGSLRHRSSSNRKSTTSWRRGIFSTSENREIADRAFQPEGQGKILTSSNGYFSSTLIRPAVCSSSSSIYMDSTSSPEDS